MKKQLKNIKGTETPLINKLINRFEDERMKEEPQAWEKLESMYTDIGTAILNSAHGINDNMAIIGAYNREHPEYSLRELNVIVNAVNSDLQLMSQQLRDNHMLHSDKSGVVTEEDYSLCLEVFNNYVIINDQYRALIFPAMLTLTEKTMEIINLIKKEASVQDVKVVTDVAVKEPVESI